MNSQHELFDQPGEPQADDQLVTDRLAPSLTGSLAPIMHPDSLARIEANYQAWLKERKEKEESQ